MRLKAKVARAHERRVCTVASHAPRRASRVAHLRHARAHAVAPVLQRAHKARQVLARRIRTGVQRRLPQLQLLPTRGVQAGGIRHGEAPARAVGLDAEQPHTAKLGHRWQCRAELPLQAAAQHQDEVRPAGACKGRLLLEERANVSKPEPSAVVHLPQAANRCAGA